MFVTRYHVRKTLGRELVVWVHPRSITQHWEQNQPLTHRARQFLRSETQRLPWLAPAAAVLHKVLYSVEPYAVPARWFPQTLPLEDSPIFGLVHDYLVESAGVAPRSRWYASLQGQLDRHGHANHKGLRFTSVADIQRFFDTYVRDIVTSMQKDGYILGKGPDIGTALIDGWGRLVKTAAGNHRFAFAHALNLASVPLEVVGVHADWLRRTAGGLNADRLRAGVRAVEAAHLTPVPPPPVHSGTCAPGTTDHGAGGSLFPGALQ